MELLILFVTLIGLILIGVPIAYSLGGAGITYFLLTNPIMLINIPQKVWLPLNSFILIAMPLFMFAGELMNHGGLTKRLINFSLLLVKPLRGGLGEVNVVASMIFGGITGSSVADTSALGSILIPDMIDMGYSKEFTTGVTVASSTVGMIIPPSIPMLMYAMVSSESVGKLFAAGLIPGILIGVFMLVYTWVVSEKKGYHDFTASVEMKKSAVFKDGILAVLMPVMILVLVVGGITTASESAAAAVVYAFILGFFVYGELTWKDVVESLKKTAIMTASVMIIGGFTSIFTWVLAINQIPALIADTILSSGVPTWVILLGFDILILFLGTFIDVVPCILLLTPILMPVMNQLGISTLHFGIIMIIGLAIGLVTPPVGMCLNVATKIAKMSIVDCFKAAAPFLICNIAVLLIVTFIPAATTWLPSLLM